jgi:flagellar basal-body rod protein FlgF/flagellar basal-body rod protein FlgG
VTPQPAAAGVRVVQGAIEQSNVRGVIEMSRMIELTRTYAQVASFLQQASEQRQSAITKLAEVPA